MSDRIDLSSSSDVLSDTNLMGSIGGSVAHYLIHDVCGIMAFLVPLFPFAISMKLFFPKKSYHLVKTLAMLVFVIGWSTTTMGYGHYAKASTSVAWYLFPGKMSMSIATYWGNQLGAGVLLLLGTSLITVAIIVIFDVFPALKVRVNGAVKKRVKAKEKENVEEASTSSTEDREEPEEESSFATPTSLQAEIEEEVQEQTVEVDEESTTEKEPFTQELS